MTEAYETHDARYIQYRSYGSAANALVVYGDVVPAGKVWTIIQAAIETSVAETQDFWFSVNASLINFPVTTPTSFALAPASAKYYPMLREGMELRLYPGEKLAGQRAAATAGSTITIFYRWIETDLPYYKYIEPLNRVVQSRRKHGEAYRTTGGISPGSPPPSGGGGGSDGGEPKPI